MQFKPKSEKEIQEQMLWPKGEYAFEVLKAELTKSGPKSKNPGTEYIKLTLRVWSADGFERFQNAILHPAMDAQLRHFCVETKMIEKYETGTLQPEDCEGKTGVVRLKVKDADGDYPAKNEVADYGTKKKKAAEGAPESEQAADDAAADESMPF